MKAAYLRDCESFEVDHAQAFFRQLAWRNVEAFVTVYEDRHRPLRCPEWDRLAYHHDFPPMALLKAAKSIAYQLSDAPGWAESAERELLDAVISNVTCELPGFRESEGWSFL
jgi:hypothetical protein